MAWEGVERYVSSTDMATQAARWDRKRTHVSEGLPVELDNAIRAPCEHGERDRAVKDAPRGVAGVVVGRRTDALHLLRINEVDL